jgi:hypothetical protein
VTALSEKIIKKCLHISNKKQKSIKGDWQVSFEKFRLAWDHIQMRVKQHHVSVISRDIISSSGACYFYARVRIF